jgi:hypothetical protein
MRIVFTTAATSTLSQIFKRISLPAQFVTTTSPPDNLAAVDLSLTIEEVAALDAVDAAAPIYQAREWTWGPCNRRSRRCGSSTRNASPNPEMIEIDAGPYLEHLPCHSAALTAAPLSVSFTYDHR